MNEIWKDIIDDFHQVSNYGRVRCLDHYTLDSIGRLQFRKGKIMKLKSDKDGYLTIALGETSYRVHRLVAEAFIPNPYNLPQINHKDENKANNRVENLEWCTAKYNCNYSGLVERRKRNIDFKSIAKQHEKGIIQYSINGDYIKEYDSIKSASIELGIDKSTIVHHLKGTRHKTNAGGFVFKYKNK